MDTSSGQNARILGKLLNQRDVVANKLFLDSSNKRDEMNYSFWIKLSLAITVIALIHSFTLTISPTVWPDEVDIIDYGRVALQPNTEWSINWQEEDRPRLMLSYLGPILQEWAFQFSGESLVGPRAISLIGALAAATIAVGWLRSRGTSAFKAGLLGLIFLLDPLFTQSYRGARVDGWAMALGLGACWVLSRTSWRIQNGRTYHGMVLLAGALDLLAFFVWPSAVMLFPLAFVELRGVASAFSKTGQYRKGFFSSAFFCIGGLGAGIILLIPFNGHLALMVHDYRAIMIAQSQVSKGLSQLTQVIVDMFYAIRLSPFLPFIGFLSLFLQKDRYLLCAGGIALGIFVITHSYVFRYIYLIPYFLCIIAMAFQATSEWKMKIPFGLISNIGLIVALVWGISLSLIVRPGLALSQRESRDMEILVNAGKEWIGSGQHRVLLGSIEEYSQTREFYYVGRSLNWQMFIPQGRYDDQSFHGLCLNMDYAILQSPVKAQTVAKLKKAGLCHLVTVNGKKSLKGKAYINELHKGAQLYGPYELYSRCTTF